MDVLHRYRPSPALASRVQCYWHLRHGGAASSPRFMHPEAGSGIIFILAGALVLDGETQQAATLACGPAMRSARVEFTGPLEAFGIRFQPGHGYPFFGLPLPELRGHRDLALLPRPLQVFEALHGRLAEARGTPERIALIEATLLQRLGHCPPRHHPDMVRLLGMIARHRGTLPLSRLMDHSGIGQRQLERLFSTQVGFTPKQFSRLQRVGYARELIKSAAEASMTDIAYRTGFADQAHFTHEFRRVMGITPGAYHAKRLALTTGRAFGGAGMRSPRADQALGVAVSSSGTSPPSPSTR